MNTRMQMVAEQVALTVLQSASAASDPPIEPDALREAFRARWPTQDGQRPMNDAMSAAAQAASKCSSKNAESWETILSQAWQTAVEEVVDGCFKAAHHSFEKGEPLEGVETLTDAVRATLGHIAAVRNWPHGKHEDLYSIAAALGSGSEWPNTLEEFDTALEKASAEGDKLGAALGASMGRPDMLSSASTRKTPRGRRKTESSSPRRP